MKESFKLNDIANARARCWLSVVELKSFQCDTIAIEKLFESRKYPRINRWPGGRTIITINPHPHRPYNSDNAVFEFRVSSRHLELHRGDGEINLKDTYYTFFFVQFTKHFSLHRIILHHINIDSCPSHHIVRHPILSGAAFAFKLHA